jgi:hypothetical protein
MTRERPMKKRLKEIFVSGDIRGLSEFSIAEILKHGDTTNLYTTAENGHLEFLRYYHRKVL